ncbi:hypothetical protein [Acidithiobacillus thiooxidans]|uniref:hypothetical protein n=1 Tax=Acidithiobacillus thiooxidans TaxID=930 RepID=UPI001C064F4B|nr:hypothetical protein [Acidithiobacillus thiooxidans]MBU2843551.1 hypothetical protein [Acidithiobacillus thiooxidans]
MDIQDMASSKPTDIDRVLYDKVVTNVDSVARAVMNNWNAYEIIYALADDSWFPNVEGLTGSAKRKQERENDALMKRLKNIFDDAYDEMREKYSQNSIRVSKNVRLVKEYAQLCKVAGEYANAIPAPVIDYGDQDNDAA